MTPETRRALFLPLLLATSASAGSTTGDRIDKYQLVATLGEGAMGRVYLAIQTEPVERQVALKVIRDEVADPEQRRQFQREAQALALANHDHIARLFEAGTSASGEDWFAMEYVAGEGLLAYCDRRQLGVAARVELVAQVCDAVDHLHALGIHHQDIKAENVLVVERDGRPVPKLVDLGLARFSRGSEHDDVTRGTPSHMAPEQFVLPPEAVDGRADVHALGVMLYEVLIGKLPFTPIDWTSPGTPQRGISREPLSPSERLRAAGDEARAIAAARGTGVRELTRSLRRGLDAIAKRAVAVDRRDRTASAGQLARDLRGHLEAVEDGRRRWRTGLVAALTGALAALSTAALAAI